MDGGGHDRASALARHYRRAAGLTQRQLAGAAGLSIGVVRDLEQGRTSRLQARSADALARALSLGGRQAGEFVRAVRAGADAAPCAARRPAGLRISVLGPLTVHHDDSPAELGPPVRRAILALLALAPGELVRRSSIIDALWPHGPPPTAVDKIHAHVGRLRRLIDPGHFRRDPAGLLACVPGGYRLRVSPAQLDLLAFGDLVRRARSAGTAGNPGVACDRYEQALGLWRDEPAADVSILADHPAVVGLIRNRAAVVCDYGEIACGEGRHAPARPYLSELAQRDPLNERAHALLMIALAGCGQQADALAVFDDLRRRLDDQLGVRPCAELAQAHQRVLRQQIPAAAPAMVTAATPARAGAAGPVILRQLPAAQPYFAGRESELSALSGMLAGAAGRGRAGPGQAEGPGHAAAIVISVSGIAGVGKTALAVQWAHQVAGEFPDGQLHADLRGFGPGGQQVSPGAVIGDFLTALGVQARDLPAGPEAQAALYRSMLAGRRMLVLLDNARDSAQVTPLLPAGPGCLTLITSRASLIGLAAMAGGNLVRLNVLTAAQARQLLTVRLGEPRAAAEPAAVAKIATLTGQLPLALSIVAARAAAHPGRRLAVLAAELRSAASRLDALDGGEVPADLRAALSWSCQQLSNNAGRMFRLLGLHPGPDISVTAAASLAGLDGRRARRELAELAGAGLVSESADGRYACHDLTRAYAAELGGSMDTPADRDAAAGRMLDHYLHAVVAARALISPASRPHQAGAPRPGVRREQLGSYRQAAGWFEAELPVLRELVLAAVRLRQDSHAHRLAAAMSTYLDLSGRWEEWLQVMDIGLAAARRDGDEAAQGWTHRYAGAALLSLGRPDEALAHLQDALGLFSSSGAVQGQGLVRASIAVVLAERQQFAQGLDQAQQAATAFRAAGDAKGEAQSLNIIGWTLTGLGRYDQAVESCTEALRLCRETGDRRLAANTLDTLGQALQRRGQHDQAIASYQRAVGECRKLGHRWGEADALTHLGDAHHDRGDQEQARLTWCRALALLDDLRHPHARLVRARLGRPEPPGAGEPWAGPGLTGPGLAGPGQASPGPGGCPEDQAGTAPQP